MKCPNCGNEQEDSLLECGKCRIIFKKWYKKEERVDFDNDGVEHKEAKPKNRVFLITVLCLGAAFFFISKCGKKTENNFSSTNNFNGNAGTEKMVTISKGKEVDIKMYLVKDYVVVFDFYADWCGPCLVLGPKLEDLAGQYNDVLIRKIDIINWKSPVVKQYKINFVPNVHVYDKNGNLIGSPTSDYNTIVEYIEKARS